MWGRGGTQKEEVDVIKYLFYLVNYYSIACYPINKIVILDVSKKIIYQGLN